MRLRTTLTSLATTLVALVAFSAQAQAAATVTLSMGHVDVFDPLYAGGTLALEIKDDTTPPAVHRAPADVLLQVLPQAKTTVPSSSAYSFLGTAGSPVWILPQTQNANLLWPGWNTQRLTSSTFGSAQLSLLSVTGGQVAVYTTSAFGTPTVLFNSGDGLPDTKPLAIGTHAHANWAFKTAGSYTATFQFTGTTVGGATVSSAPTAYTFEVLP
jgi:surface-anchored protein